MVRPKPSFDTLDIAGDFAEIVTVKIMSRRRPKSSVKVECKGPNSIFAAIKCCLPHLARVKNEPAKKGAVSEVQLNKYLIRVGFIPYRHRQRVVGEPEKWSKGCQQWANVRWIDLCNPEEVQRLRERLPDIALRFPKKFTVCEESLFTFLNNVNSQTENDPFPFDKSQSKEWFAADFQCLGLNHDSLQDCGWRNHSGQQPSADFQCLGLNHDSLQDCGWRNHSGQQPSAAGCQQDSLNQHFLPLRDGHSQSSSESPTSADQLHLVPQRHLSSTKRQEPHHIFLRTCIIQLSRAIGLLFRAISLPAQELVHHNLTPHHALSSTPL